MKHYLLKLEPKHAGVKPCYFVELEDNDSQTIMKTMDIKHARRFVDPVHAFVLVGDNATLLRDYILNIETIEG